MDTSTLYLQSLKASGGEFTATLVGPDFPYPISYSISEKVYRTLLVRAAAYRTETSEDETTRMYDTEAQQAAQAGIPVRTLSS